MRIFFLYHIKTIGNYLFRLRNLGNPFHLSGAVMEFGSNLFVSVFFLCQEQKLWENFTISFKSYGTTLLLPSKVKWFAKLLSRHPVKSHLDMNYVKNTRALLEIIRGALLEIIYNNVIKEFWWLIQEREFCLTNQFYLCSIFQSYLDYK